MTTRRHVWGMFLIGVLVGAAAGCHGFLGGSHFFLPGNWSSFRGATSPTELMIASAVPIDLPGLAGTWQGTASGPQGLSEPITMRISTDGTYSTGSGVYATQGTAQIKDGKLLVLTHSSTTGGQTAGLMVTAVFSERRQANQIIQVLAGSGSSSAGPYSFEVSRFKQ